jgi:hypothetical protein
MRVQSKVWVWIEMKKSALQRIARCQREGLCLACLEPLAGTVLRGCHERCAKATYRAIAKGLLTDEGQVACGEWAEPRSGREPSNPVSIKAKAGAS